MSDLGQLLDRTARAVDVTPSAETVDADVRRGRAAFAGQRRGRAIRFSIAGAVVAAFVGSTIVAADQGVAPGRGTPVRLVAYHGEQLEGSSSTRFPTSGTCRGRTPSD
jgi:hypothetical protein